MSRPDPSQTQMEPIRGPRFRERRRELKEQRRAEQIRRHDRIMTRAFGLPRPSVGEHDPEPQHITARSMLRSIECLSAALTASGVAVDSVVQSAQRGAEEGLRRRLGARS